MFAACNNTLYVDVYEGKGGNMMKLTAIISLCFVALITICGCTPKENNIMTETEYLSPQGAPEAEEISLEGYTTYYFDADAGKDSNDGRSEISAKQTLAEAEKMISSVAGEGVRILFRAGDVYEGKLTVRGFRASDEKPLILGAWGANNAERYVKIIGGVGEACLEIRGSNVRVSGFELTAPTGIRGIYLNTEKEGAMKNVVIADNYVHDINWNWQENFDPAERDSSDVNTTAVCPNDKFVYTNGGIVCNAATAKAIGPSWFENVWIQGNRIECVARSGIFVNSNWVRRPGIDWGYNHYSDDENGWYCHKNFNVLSNEISYAGGDSIVVIAADGLFIEKNISLHAQYLGRSGSDGNVKNNAGIWPHSCKNVLIQYNEAAFTHKDNGAGDGQGFDIDIGCSDVIFRYNYSHHNEGGGLLLCNNLSAQFTYYDRDGNVILDEMNLPKTEVNQIADWRNVRVSNNVFAYNAEEVVEIVGKCDSIEFSNNTVIVDPALDRNGRQTALITAEYPAYLGRSKGLLIANNLFHLTATADLALVLSQLDDFVAEYNVFSNFEESFFAGDVKSGKEYREENAGLGSKPASLGWESAKSFAVANSAFSRYGTFLSKMNELDYAQTNVKNAVYIGAFLK